jgi:hypothetical protein
MLIPLIPCTVVAHTYVYDGDIIQYHAYHAKHARHASSHAPDKMGKNQLITAYGAAADNPW